jgi:hypothetical protein
MPPTRILIYVTNGDKLCVCHPKILEWVGAVISDYT